VHRHCPGGKTLNCYHSRCGAKLRREALLLYTLPSPVRRSKTEEVLERLCSAESSHRRRWPVETAQCRQCTAERSVDRSPLRDMTKAPLSLVTGGGPTVTPVQARTAFFPTRFFAVHQHYRYHPHPPPRHPASSRARRSPPALVSSRLSPPHVPSSVVVCSSTGQLAASVSACCNPSATRHPVATPASPSHVHELRHRRHRRPSPSPPPRRKLRHSPTAARVRFFVPQR
jgi:hypothetical protein